MLIAIEREDGGVSILTMSADTFTVQEIEAEVAKWESTSGKVADGGFGKALNWHVMEPNVELPPRDERAQWTVQDGKVVVSADGQSS